jgi:type I restriction enzyme S subunit
MEEWKEYKVAEVIEEISMGPFGSNIKRDNYVDSGVPYLNGSNLSSYKLNEDSFNYVTEEKAKSLGRCVAKRGDIIVTHRGTIGQISYIPFDSKYENYLTGNSQFRLTVNNKLIRPDFFVYYFHTRMGQHRLLANASQVGVPALARPTSTFKEVLVPVPKIEVQNKIMEILHSLDDKIEVNKRINENLEQQAQALFKSWFVDFEPFKDGELVESELGMIPKGWRVESLSSVADFINGLAMQKYRPKEGEKGLPVLKIKELGQGNIDDNSELCSPTLIGDKFIINDGDIIFSWSGTLMVKVWCGGKCGLNQHLFVVVPKDNQKWFVYQWTKFHLDNFIRIAKDKAVTMGHIKRGELDKAKVIIPDSDNLTRITLLMDPIFNQVISNEIESRRLATLRDTLLPKLMSGELKLNETII